MLPGAVVQSDPVAETTGDPNSYGFRRTRSTADAIMQCYTALGNVNTAEWVLEGDITAECAVGYHDETGRLVGVVLIGLTRELLTYRTRIATERPTPTDAAATLSTAR